MASCVVGAGQSDLYPGDIIPTMLTAHVSSPGNNSALSGHVGFVVMKDIEGGTTLTIRMQAFQEERSALLSQKKRIATATATAPLPSTIC
jgi:hypothetical protein